MNIIKARGIMVDLHCHILPSVDDGVSSESKMLEMAKEYLQMGVTKVCATPHFRAGMFDNKEEDIRQVLEQSKTLLAENNIDLNLRAGAEYFWDSAFIEKLETPEVFLTFGDFKKHLLVEFASLSKPLNLREVVFELKLKGITLVMAHPERYAFVADNLNWVEELVDAGMLLQGTLGPLYGMWGSKPRKTLKKLLDRKLIHIVSSDAHRTEDVKKHYGKAAKRLAAITGQGRAEQLLRVNPEKIFDGEGV